MSICHRCGMRAGSSDECADCTTFYREVLAQCRRDERLREAAPEMLEMLRLASWPVCRRTGYEDCGLCDTCRARALIAKIEEV